MNYPVEVISSQMHSRLHAIVRHAGAASPLARDCAKDLCRLLGTNPDAGDPPEWQQAIARVSA